jgi:hypothetical protein
MLCQRGIRYAERFQAVFAVVEKPYRGQLRREMWLVDGHRLHELIVRPSLRSDRHARPFMPDRRSAR